MLNNVQKGGIVVGVLVIVGAAYMGAKRTPEPVAPNSPSHTPTPLENYSKDYLETPFQVAVPYPEPEMTAGFNPYRAPGIAISSDSLSPAISQAAGDIGNQWIRVDQGSQAKANFPPGTPLLMAVNASYVYIAFKPAVHGANIALGNSDLGPESFVCQPYNGTKALPIVSVAGMQSSDSAGAPAPTLNYAVPAGETLTALRVTKTGDRPQLGLLLGPVTTTP